MPMVKEIYDYIDSIAPFSEQCQWDNSGLNVGDWNHKVETVAVALDITPDVVAYAKQIGAQLIVSHHPVMYHPRKQILCNDPVYQLISSGISAVCAHTSLDKAQGGVNDALAEKLGFAPCVPFAKEGDSAMIRLCTLSTPVSVSALADIIEKKLGGRVRFCDCGKPVSRIALCGGEGTDFIREIAEAQCDAFITGDCRHHNFLDASALGLSVLAAGHYETENPVCHVLAEKLKKAFEIYVAEVPTKSSNTTL